MSTPITIPRFGRTVASLEGKGQQHQPTRMMNFSTTAAKLKFRYGYANVQGAPVTPDQDFACLGLNFVQNRSGVAELLGVEKHDTTVRAYRYSIDGPHAYIPGDFGRYQLGAEGDPALDDREFVISSYADNAYFIKIADTNLVENDPTVVYRHIIGTDTSLDLVQNTAHVDHEDPDLIIDHRTPSQLYPWVNTDSVAFAGANTYTIGSITSDYTEPGVVLFAAPSEDHLKDGGYLEITTTFASSVDFTDHDYIYIPMVGQFYLNYFNPTTVKPQLKTSSGWHDVTDAHFVVNDNYTKDATWVIYLKGMSDLDAIEGIKIQMNIKPGRNAHGADQWKFLKVYPIVGGGSHLQAATASSRTWDSNRDGDGITYGARYTNGTGTSAIIQRTISKDEGWGYYADPQDTDHGSYGPPVGGIISLTVDPPSGIYTGVEFLRLDSSTDPPKWKKLHASPITAEPYTYRDEYEEHEVPGLTDAADGDAPGITPVFNTDGIVGAFPFKQFMVWLLASGSANIQMSRVGNAEELYDDNETYDEGDLTQPGVRTLADNADDQPVWGTQAGDVAIILGKKAAYVMHGDYPVQMSPTRQIAGSRGIIGRYAGVRFRSEGGQYAAAYCDPDFNIWVVESVPEFQGDGRGRPTELSLQVRGLVKTFLYDEQQLVNPLLDGKKTQLEFDEESSTLWVILGNRAAVYRQDLNESGWEFYSYSLQSDGDVTVDVHTPFSGNGGVASSVAPGDKPFVNFGYPFASDDNYCAAGPMAMDAGQMTETLRIDGLTPTTLLPATATILGVSYEIERSQSGDFQMTETKTQPRKGGVDWGDDFNTNLMLSDTDVNSVYEITTGLPTVEEINGGQLGIDLQYTQEDVNPAWNDPANWTITINHNLTYIDTAATSYSYDRDMTVTYIGPGTKPPFVRVSLDSSTECRFAIGAAPTHLPGDIYWGKATADNGIGNVVTTDLYYMGPQVSVSHSSKVLKIPLSSGVGTFTFTVAGQTLSSSASAGISLTNTSTGTFVPYVPSTVRVDNVNTSIHYSVTTLVTAPWVGWDQACFTYDGRRVAIRNTGEIDLIEKDFRNSSFIDGPNRDGGFIPPDAEWTSQDFPFDGMTARFHGVQVNTLRTDDSPGVFSKIIGGSWLGGFQTGYSSSRWFRFPLSQRSIQHSFKLTMPETEGGVESLTLEFDQTSTSKVR